MGASRKRDGKKRGKKSKSKKLAVSAGGVVWRPANSGDQVEVVLVQTPAQRWGLPKGKPNNGERLPETALREVSEETGLTVALDRKIGVMRYSFAPGRNGRIDKAVHFWLMKPTGGALENHDDEHIDVRWFPLGDALRTVSYRNTVSILEDAAELLLDGQDKAQGVQGVQGVQG